jgi:two-component system, OmpR family, response regulator
MLKQKTKIFLVDDDVLYLKNIEIGLNDQSEFEISTYSTGELCLSNLSQKPDVIILDFNLNSIEQEAKNGLQTLIEIKKINPVIQVVMLSSQDSIEVAVSCMQNKAFDYVVKSETALVRLQKIINTILEFNKIQKELNWYIDKI